MRRLRGILGERSRVTQPLRGSFLCDCSLEERHSPWVEESGNMLSLTRLNSPTGTRIPQRHCLFCSVSDRGDAP